MLVLVKDLGLRLPKETSTKLRAYGLYRCDCGTEFEVLSQNVKLGITTKCVDCSRKISAIKNASTKEAKQKVLLDNADGSYVLRECKHCGTRATTKEELELFSIGVQSKFGRQNICKECENKRALESDRVTYNKEYAKKKRAEQCPIFKRAERNQNLKRYYGITIDDFEKMYNSQNGKCKICHSDNNGKTFHVDHCHMSGRVRGLLCSKCNTAIGLLDENIVVLENAIKYLTAQEVALA